MIREKIKSIHAILQTSKLISKLFNKQGYTLKMTMGLSNLFIFSDYYFFRFFFVEFKKKSKEKTEKKESKNKVTLRGCGVLGIIG